MKRTNIIPLTMFLVGMALDSYAGSVTLSNSRIESLLSAAGFQILTGPDALQEIWYTRSTPHTLERHIANGRIVYTYADQRGCFIYLGGQPEYQQYERILRETLVAETELQATAPPDQAWRDWRWTWKPWKLVVWSYQPGNR